MAPRAAALRLLDELQLRESRLLSWGMVDGSFSQEELVALANECVLNSGSSVEGEEVLLWLLERGLLFRVPYTDNGYRTRVGEGVRLFARLRQLFPWRPWQESPELIADFRFATLPRRYPERHITAREAVDQFSECPEWTGLQESVAFDLLGGRETTWMLADFQMEATREILRHTRDRRPTASIICAGTGSGKTLAFYLPAILHIAKQSEVQESPHCVALYPRTELLRDQLRTAVQHSLQVDLTLRHGRGRPLSIGALYGATPRNSEDLDHPWHRDAWQRVRLGEDAARRCPYLDCPICNAPLAWKDCDRSAGTERLCCTNDGCHTSIEGEVLRLTRNSMAESPPDILFSTTEMLNRGLGNRALWKLLGIDSPPPSLVLLDEVHTYGGSHGAQVALTLRRWANLSWRRSSRAAPHFVGLSATLADARRFMTELVGTYPNLVGLIEPKRMVTEGCEHILVLRGRPGTATLSATIQSAMLLRRLLEPKPTNRANLLDGAETKEFFGRRVFAFTDNLDVTNRLYFQLGDAEGWRHPGARQPASHVPLASLRSTSREDRTRRFRNGQSWDLIENIGHSLARDARCIVSRTSSQDVSVESDADIVVATASLEVGFDDPLVGGVIQHQAPKDPAAYVQRKGRAGRTRLMRPWTVVVLSDWGRDRLAYQSYENLFSPSVPARYLPLKNRHILRMQATLSFMDWIAIKTGGANLWSDLAKPATTGSAAASRQQQITRQIRTLLEDDAYREQFARHLKFSLDLENDEEANALLWEAPRSLVFGVWPTVLRRLERKWRRADGGVDGGADNEQRPHPLPEFIPRALFEDLNLPEVVIDLERDHARDGATDAPAMPIRQALTEFAPGRVTLRYAIADAAQADWVSPPTSLLASDDATIPFDTTINIYDFCEPKHAQPLGVFQYLDGEQVREVETFRPHRIKSAVVPAEIDPRSDSRPRWHTQIVPHAPGTPLSIPEKSPWRYLIPQVHSHTHLHGNPVEMRRFSTAAVARIKRVGPPATRQEGPLSYLVTDEFGSRPAAVGFAADVDALCVDLKLPPKIHTAVTEDPALLRSLRPMLFMQGLLDAPALNNVLDIFQRRLVAEAYMAATLLVAQRYAVAVARALELLEGAMREQIFAEVFSVLRPPSGAQGNEETDPADTAQYDELLELVRNDDVRSCLRQHGDVLHRPLDDQDEEPLRHAVKATLGGALLSACQRLCPQLRAEDLLIDLSPGPTFDGKMPADQLWLSEASVGGCGFIEAVRQAWMEDPSGFFSLMRAELEPSDFEETDFQLRELLSRLSDDPENFDEALARQFDSVRGAKTFAELTVAFDKLLEALRDRGLAPSHSAVNAISLRLLRPGSSPASDRLIADLIRRCDELENTHGVELDDRIHAALLALNPDVSAALEDAIQDGTGAYEPSRRHSIVSSLLWPRGGHVRHQSLAFWNPFDNNHYCDRLLVARLLPDSIQRVRVSADGWRQRLEEALVADGQAELVGSPEDSEALRKATLELVASKMASDVLLVYPRVRSFRRQGTDAIIVVDLAEIS